MAMLSGKCNFSSPGKNLFRSFHRDRIKSQRVQWVNSNGSRVQDLFFVLYVSDSFRTFVD